MEHAINARGNRDRGEGASVYVVTPVFNQVALTRAYLTDLKRVTYPNVHVIIVDDGSSDGTYETVTTEHPDVTVLQGDGNLWWAGGTNLGVAHALEQGAEYILTLNNDVEVEPDFLTELVRVAQANPRSIVGCRIQHLHDHQLIWGVGAFMDWGEFVLFNLHYADQPLRVLQADEVPNPFEVELLCGNGALFPADCFREVGLYDSRHFPQYHADSEMCLRARKRGGYRTLVALDAVIYNDSENIGGAQVQNVWEQLFSIRSYFNVRLYFRIIKYHPGGFWKHTHLRLVYLWHFARIIFYQLVAPWAAPLFRKVMPPAGRVVRGCLRGVGLDLRPAGSGSGPWIKRYRKPPRAEDP